MSKLLAALIAGLFAVGVYAQGGPKSDETQIITDSKSDMAAEKKVDKRNMKRPNRMIQKGEPGDLGASDKVDPTAMGKPAKAAAARKGKRDMKHPNRMPTTQGGTPKDVLGPEPK